MTKKLKRAMIAHPLTRSNRLLSQKSGMRNLNPMRPTILFPYNFQRYKQIIVLHFR